MDVEDEMNDVPAVVLSPVEPIDEIAAALAKAQATIRPPARNREVVVKTKTGGSYTFRYTTLDAVVEAVRKPLTDNGLWFIQPLVNNGDGKYALITMLIHSSGQRLVSTTPLLVSEPGNQAFGSALTYMRRYALAAMLGIASEEDDDGNAAAGNEARGRPVWHGPLNKTALKAALREFDSKLMAVKSLDELDTLAGEYDAVLCQVEIDMPEVWAGDGGDITGTADRIAARQRDLGDAPAPKADTKATPASADALITEICTHDNVQRLAAWGKDNKARIERLGKAEIERVRRAYKERLHILGGDA